VHAGHAGLAERTERTRHKPKEQRKIAPGGRPSSAKRSKKQRGKKR
jgi:hypothetical protein